jgi:MFS family permease
MKISSSLVQGMRANWQQFALLVLVNAFVGAMLGLERTIVPLIASKDFGLTSVSVTLSFIISFGIVKAFANVFTGRNADRYGRKPLLLLGWLFALPVPFLVIFAPSWEWIVFANLLLGLNQGLCWSSTVMMKIDLVGAKERGRATGMNEFAGYFAMAASTIASSWIAEQTALRPYPFYLGIGFVSIGLILSFFFVRETVSYARQEALNYPTTADEKPSFWTIFRLVSWQNKSFFSLSQAGLINNLNDVVIWGLLPLLALQVGMSAPEVARIGGTYLVVWGISQLGTGVLSDLIGRKPLITGGLWLQSLGIFFFVLSSGETAWLTAAVIMGLGTGMVYPTLLASISDHAHPAWRASALGIYRLWRDSGYAFGALLAGILSDVFNLATAILTIAVLTFIAGLLSFLYLTEANKRVVPRQNSAT